MKKTFDSPDGILDTPTYADRLGAIVEEIDEKAFLPFRNGIKATPLEKRFPGERSAGYHVKKVITYRAIRPAHPFTKRLLKKEVIESYFIWGGELDRIAEEKFRNTAVEDMSDGKFLRMLIACALVAVRYRVLQHKEFFPNARLWSLAGVYNDASIPEHYRTQIFAKRRTCVELAGDPLALDAHILLTLVQMAQDDGTKILDALHYLTNSKEVS